jgi:hypothetical protein
VIVKESVTAQCAHVRVMNFIEEHFSAPINYSADMEEALMRLAKGEQ